MLGKDRTYTAIFTSQTLYRWKKYNINNITEYTWDTYTVNQVPKIEASSRSYQLEDLVQRVLVRSSGDAYFYQGYTSSFPESLISGNSFYVGDANHRTYGGDIIVGGLPSIWGLYGGAPYFEAGSTYDYMVVPLTAGLSGRQLAEYQYYSDSKSARCTIYTITQTYEKGSKTGSISSNNSGTYPSNGVSGSYWYVYTGSQSSQVMGSYISEVTSISSNTYPTNGISGSYWYILQ